MLGKFKVIVVGPERGMQREELEMGLRGSERG